MLTADQRCLLCEDLLERDYLHGHSNYDPRYVCNTRHTVDAMSGSHALGASDVIQDSVIPQSSRWSVSTSWIKDARSLDSRSCVQQTEIVGRLTPPTRLNVADQQKYSNESAKTRFTRIWSINRQSSRLQWTAIYINLISLRFYLRAFLLLLSDCLRYTSKEPHSSRLAAATMQWHVHWR